MKCHRGFKKLVIKRRVSEKDVLRSAVLLAKALTEQGKARSLAGTARRKTERLRAMHKKTPHSAASGLALANAMLDQDKAHLLISKTWRKVREARNRHDAYVRAFGRSSSRLR